MKHGLHLNVLHSKHLKCSSYAILILRSRQINGRIFCHSIRIGGTECIWVFGFIMISNSWPRKLNIWLMIYYMSPTNFEYIPCRDGMPDMDGIKKESFLINLWRIHSVGKFRSKAIFIIVQIQLTKAKIFSNTAWANGHHQNTASIQKWKEECHLVWKKNLIL